MCDGTTQLISNITIVTTEHTDTSLEHLVSMNFARTIPMKSSAPVFWSLSLKYPGNSFDAYYLGLSFSGCDFQVHWVNPPVNKTAVASRSSCTSICPDDADGELTNIAAGDAAEYCGSSNNGTGCCNILFGDDLQGVPYVSLAKLKFVRYGRADPRLHHNLSFLWDTINVTLYDASANWKIVDQTTCASAIRNKATYAGVSRNSVCQDNFSGDYGYRCKCRTGYRGNPYILHGCKPDNAFISLESGYNPSQPKSNCTRRCGSINVPFPFGLEEGCFAREQFHLDCTNKTSSAILLYSSMDNYQECCFCGSMWKADFPRGGFASDKMDVIAEGAAILTPMMGGKSRGTCDLGFCKVEITVAWSLFSILEDLHLRNRLSRYRHVSSRS
ncbi:hypothetical protein C2845_PM04G15760 [Panicum miliaceum]|uniref:Wall-associated receptor kinase galacturonan-binding domain-containing protein n=1 Tax=Panicum miliaceum TaxID=4540 RepID=A0A3L6QRA0_PANMI|nr:hypothetical protein C2845_PM04G15760 [Panicum miliaceum]